MGNTERNSYVKEKITETLIRLLKEKQLTDISISEIIQEAQVSRNSFYRNYSEKEDILRDRIRTLLTDWKAAYDKTGKDSNSELYQSLFTHLKEHRDFYLLLRERHLFHLFQQVYLSLYGPPEDLNNITAYIVSFISYGTYGWIEEWMKRGMHDTPEEMAALLSLQGSK